MTMAVAKDNKNNTTKHIGQAVTHISHGKINDL